MEIEDIPEEVMESWLKQCSCCPACGCRPCDDVMAGGLCEEICFCGIDDYQDCECSECIGD